MEKHLKNWWECKAGSCTRPGVLACRNCGRTMCPLHYDQSKGLCLACAAQSSGYRGCLVAFVGLAVLIGIVVLIVVKNTGQPSSAPFSLQQDVTSNGHSVKIDKGSSITFHVNVPQAGMYNVSFQAGVIWGNGLSDSDGGGMVVDVTVNGNPFIKTDGQTNAISTLTNGNNVQLSSGDNSIQISLNDTQCDLGGCKSLAVSRIFIYPPN